MKKLAFGFMRLPLLDKDDNTSIDIETCKKMVDYFIEKGFTYFDTAWMYHDEQSEIVLGKWLQTKKRSSLYVITKSPV